MISSETPYKLAEIIRDTWPGLYRPPKKHYDKSSRNKKMYEFYSVINLNNGVKVCECATLEDAQMIVGLNPANRAYRKERFILDQIIDVTSTTDKQLPGQLGLPKGKDFVTGSENEMYLTQSNAQLINI
jgi:hypothetical protein